MDSDATGSVRLAGEIVEHMVRHARWADPEEACGLLAVAGGEVRFVYACTNIEASRTRYTVDSTEHVRALEHAERSGWRLGGAFHSHPGGRPVLSPADLAGALDSTWVYAVVAGDTVRMYRVADGSATEVPLTIK